ncbi:acyl-CoA carboxylase epsilon subunit [Paenarthrobacter sp. PH39-S1]|uniref:acyl-CoA carboxylase epsilon subunit n=1 Tax=Paenarthrobacter sp. PH39-S1 TaxID=3046204 RepID=UPI0032D9AB9D
MSTDTSQPATEPMVDQGRSRPRGGLSAEPTPMAEPQPRVKPAETPVLQILRGTPSAEELAALAAVVFSLQPAEDDAPVRPAQRHWVRRAALNLAPKPGPGAWRRSRA